MTEEEDRMEYAEQNGLLRRQFDTVLTEPIPARMYLKRPPWLDYARAAMLVAVGVAIGIALPYLRSTPPSPAFTSTPLPVRAARAHLVYSPEVRHPVEVDAKDQDHLVKWLSKRLDIQLKVPILANEGFELPRRAPAARATTARSRSSCTRMRQGKRLTLYVTRPHKGDDVTAFRFAQEGPVSVFYWIDRDCGYALSGEIDKPALARVATSVHRQLES